jgi:hypothetical protein
MADRAVWGSDDSSPRKGSWMAHCVPVYEIGKILGILLVLTLGCASEGLGGHAPRAERVRLETLPTRGLETCPAFDRSPGAVDAILAIDISRSTVDPSGADIDQDGKVGESVVKPTGRIVDAISSDPGDSFLAAQVSAIHSLVKGSEFDTLRIGIVAYSGVGKRQGPRLSRRTVDAVVESDLTDSVQELESALGSVLKRGSHGNTDFASGMRLAQQTLASTPPGEGAPRRMVLFLSDSGTPVIERSRNLQREDPEIENATREAADAGITFHTFGLGAEAAKDPAYLEEIAEGTGGEFRPVTDLTTLHCELAAALARPRERP